MFYETDTGLLLLQTRSLHLKVFISALHIFLTYSHGFLKSPVYSLRPAIFSRTFYDTKW